MSRFSGEWQPQVSVVPVAVASSRGSHSSACARLAGSCGSSASTRASAHHFQSCLIWSCPGSGSGTSALKPGRPRNPVIQATRNVALWPSKGLRTFFKIVVYETGPSTCSPGRPASILSARNGRQQNTRQCSTEGKLANVDSFCRETFFSHGGNSQHSNASVRKTPASLVHPLGRGGLLGNASRCCSLAPQNSVALVGPHVSLPVARSGASLVPTQFERPAAGHACNAQETE